LDENKMPPTNSAPQQQQEKQQPEAPQGQDAWAAMTAGLVDQPVGTLFTITNPTRRETKTMMLQGVTGGPDPSQRVVLARVAAVDRIIRITPEAFHAGAVADIALLPVDAQVDVRDIWDHLGTATAAMTKAAVTPLDKLVQQASAFKPWTEVEVRKGDKASWQTVTLINATAGTPAVRWVKGRIDFAQTFSAANADEAESWQIRAVAPLTWKENVVYSVIMLLVLALGVVLSHEIVKPPRF
jgi:hypothetical protein